MKGDYMENISIGQQTTTKRKPKSQGITKGKPSNKEIRRRRKICRNIASSADSPKTQSEFLNKYKEKLRQIKNIKIPSDQTLKKDMKKCKIEFKHGSARIKPANDIFYSLGYDINYYIRQLRLIYESDDIILINTCSSPTLYPKSKTEFLAPLVHLINNETNDKNITPQDTDKSKKIPPNTIFHLHFILDKKGFEHLIEDTFNKDCDTPPYFLYIETHSYCTTIVFEYDYLNTILNKTFEIIEFYPY